MIAFWIAAAGLSVATAGLVLRGAARARPVDDAQARLEPHRRRLAEVERLAIEQRLDVKGARLAVEQTARNLGLTRTTRFVNVFELGLVRNTSNEGPRQTGWEVGLELPLFDWGGAPLPAVVRRIASWVVASAWRSIAPPPAKEPRTAFAPLRLAGRILALDQAEQSAGQGLDVQCVGSGGDHQLAKLFDLPILQHSGLVIERCQFGVEVSGLAHRSLHDGGMR